MDEKEQLRANVRAELARARISAAEMDRRLGWSRATLSRRLLSEAEFRAHELTAIARELGIPVTRLWEGVGDSPDVAPAPAS